VVVSSSSPQPADASIIDSSANVAINIIFLKTSSLSELARSVRRKQSEHGSPTRRISQIERNKQKEIYLSSESIDNGSARTFQLFRFVEVTITGLLVNEVRRR
jgi:hypothetical protein